MHAGTASLSSRVLTSRSWMLRCSEAARRLIAGRPVSSRSCCSALKVLCSKSQGAVQGREMVQQCEYEALL